MNETLDPVALEVAPFSATEAALTVLRARMAGVQYEVTNTAGMAQAKADRAELRGLRSEVESTRKALKAPLLESGKQIDAEAERIRLELVAVETPIDAQIKAEEARKEAERELRAAMERARVTAIHERIAEIRSYGTTANLCRNAQRAQSVMVNLLAMQAAVNMEVDFAEFAEQAATAYADTLQTVQAAIDARAADEAERTRIVQAQQAHAAQLKQAQEELATRTAEAFAEADQAAAELASERAQLAAERAEFAERQRLHDADLAQQKAALASVEYAQTAPVLIAEPTPTTESAPHVAIDATALAQPSRPTDRAIVAFLADGFNATPTQVLDWLATFDFGEFLTDLSPSVFNQ
jgi:chromosome segregation ATPase